MADEPGKAPSEGEGKFSVNPVVTILLAINIVAVGAIGFLQFKLQAKIEKETSVKDVVASQMKEEAAKAEAATEKGEGKEGGEAKDVPGAPPAEGSGMKTGILFPLEGFTANLAQGDGPRRYVRLNVVLKFTNESKEEEFKARQPQIRDTIISLLNTKRPEDLSRAEGKNYLKEEIKAAINAFLVDGELEDVYYVGFVIN